jgi:hypothetical protein
VKGRYLSLRRFWSTEVGLTGVLLFLLLYFIVSFSLDRFHFAKFVSLIFLSLFFFSAAISVSDRPIGKLVFGGLAVVAMVSVWTDFFFPGMGLRPWRALADILVLGYLIILLLGHVYREGAITYHRICGAIAVYILLSWMWGNTYLLILQFDPGAIKLPPELVSGSFDELEVTLSYFSIVTLTTLGYGDIVPISHAARLAVMLEALCGQLYPAIMLAWLVSMEIVDRTQKH